MSNTEFISGYFKVIARLPAGPMTVPDYFEYHSGDHLFTKLGNDRFTLEYNPTFMTRKIEFKLGEEFEEAIETGEKFTTKFTVLGAEKPDFLIQEGVGEKGGRYKILRKFKEQAVSIYPPGQIVMNMEDNGNILPWYYVLTPSNKPVTRYQPY